MAMDVEEAERLLAIACTGKGAAWILDHAPEIACDLAHHIVWLCAIRKSTRSCRLCRVSKQKADAQQRLIDERLNTLPAAVTSVERLRVALLYEWLSTTRTRFYNGSLTAFICWCDK